MRWEPAGLWRSKRARGLAFFAGKTSLSALKCTEGWVTATASGGSKRLQYLAPTVSFDIPKGPTLTFSPSFGLNSNSVGVIYRFKVSYEIQQIFSRHS